MRILIDVRFLGKGSTTGVAAYTKELVSSLLTKKDQELIFFYNGLTLAPLPTSWLTSPRTSVINWSLPNKLVQLSTRLFNAPALNKSCGADLIYSPNFHLLPYRDLPRVITFHDLSFLHYPEFFSKKDRLWHWWQGAKAAASRASHITAVSEHTKADLVAKLGLPAEKITVIYPGISAAFKPVKPSSIESRMLIKKYSLRQPFILYLGTIESRKNVELLIEAFGLLKQQSGFKDYQLVLAGRHGFGAESALRLAAQLPCASDIRFITTITDSERAILYSLARCFVYPSFFEGFGFPPLEAQACGVPVIASDRTSLSETLSGSARLVSPWKAGELAQAIRDIETNPQLRETMVSSGILNAQRFSWDAASEHLITVFKQTIS